MESQAVERRAYDVAARLQGAVRRLSEMRRDVESLEQAEAEAVLSRRYAEAEKFKLYTGAVLREYNELKSMDFWTGATTTKQVGLSSLGPDAVSSTASSMSVEAALAGTDRMDTSSLFVNVRFCIDAPTDYGEHMVVTGSVPELGDWDAEKGLLLQWTAEGWVGWTELPLGTHARFKFVRRHALEEGAACTWCAGGDRVLSLPLEPTLAVDVAGVWTDPATLEGCEEQPDLEAAVEGERVWMCFPVQCSEPELPNN